MILSGTLPSPVSLTASSAIARLRAGSMIAHAAAVASSSSCAWLYCAAIACAARARATRAATRRCTDVALIAIGGRAVIHSLRSCTLELHTQMIAYRTVLAALAARQAREPAAPVKGQH